MRILRFHAFYAQPGGEDASVLGEVALLRRAGHEVRTLFARNGDLLRRGRAAVLRALWRQAWDPDLYRRVYRLCRTWQPDVAQADNLWFALSPSLHAACRAAGVPTVQALRNYRLFCLEGCFLRRGRVCERCLGRVPWRGVAAGCYRGSRVLSALLCRSLWHGRRRGIWERHVDRFVAPSVFARRKLAAAGLPAERVRVKPDFVPDPGPPAPPGRGAVFVGRLSPEKGVAVLLRAWQHLRTAPLAVVGDGPLRGPVAAAAREGPVRALGWRDRRGCLAAIRAAGVLVAPSLCYETFGRAVVEAYACGRPVVVSDLGAPPELVRPGETGLLVPPGDADALAAAVGSLLGDRRRLRRMGAAARRLYEECFTPARNLEAMEALYGELIEGKVTTWNGSTFSGSPSRP